MCPAGRCTTEYRKRDSLYPAAILVQPYICTIHYVNQLLLLLGSVYEVWACLRTRLCTLIGPILPKNSPSKRYCHYKLSESKGRVKLPPIYK